MAKKTQKRLPRRREEFTYHGFRLDDLKKMGITELVPLMPARARRKINRGMTRGEENRPSSEGSELATHGSVPISAT
jgi:SSU ribosomal protein S19P